MATRHSLPRDALDELEAVIGYAATRRLVLRYGGGRVSSAHDPDSEVALVLREQYAAFCRHYGGLPVEVPLHLDRKRLTSDLAPRVYQDLDAGLTPDEIAPRYAIHRRTVYRLAARRRRIASA
jgi:hypothetical protein